MPRVATEPFDGLPPKIHRPSALETNLSPCATFCCCAATKIPSVRCATRRRRLMRGRPLSDLLDPGSSCTLTFRTRLAEHLLEAAMNNTRTIRLTFTGSLGHELAARLDMPTGGVRAHALFAHCFTCTKDIVAARRIAAKLASLG